MCHKQAQECQKKGTVESMLPPLACEKTGMQGLGCRRRPEKGVTWASHLLEGEESCTHLNGTAEGDLAVSLAEVHVPHTQVGSLNEHREVHLCPTSNIGVHAKDADVMTMASGTNAAGI